MLVYGILPWTGGRCRKAMLGVWHATRLCLRRSSTTAELFFLSPSSSSFIKDLTILVMCLMRAGLFVAQSAELWHGLQDIWRAYVTFLHAYMICIWQTSVYCLICRTVEICLFVSVCLCLCFCLTLFLLMTSGQRYCHYCHNFMF